MPQPPATASATAAAAASASPGGGAPILGAWLVVRRRFFLSFSKRRYVTLTDDHVLLVDSTPVLHLVDCTINSSASSKIIDLIPAPNSGVAVRIFADSPYQYSKWRLALQSSAGTSLARYYRIDGSGLLGVGVHGIVRRVYPEMPYREDSIESGTTVSEYSAQPAEHRSLSRAIFKRRIPSINRNSIDIDPDSLNHTDDFPEHAVPSSKNDKRILRQMSLKANPTNDPQLNSPMEPISMAVKTVSRNSNGPATVASEVLFARSRLNHFAIVKVHDFFEAVNEVHTVMEECFGGSLTEYVQNNGPFPEPEAKKMFSPVLKAVGYMHACGLVHWDICPNNILFASTTHPLEPKIIDFGTARPIDPGNGRVPLECGIFQEKGKVASLACASPELLTSKAHRYAAKADMWQLGCVLYFLIIGKLPFSKRNVQDLSVSSTILTYCKKRSAERREFLFAQAAIGTREISEFAKELILKLLCPNPRMRPNALQCLRDFNYFKRSSS